MVYRLTKSFQNRPARRVRIVLKSRAVRLGGPNPLKINAPEKSGVFGEKESKKEEENFGFGGLFTKKFGLSFKGSPSTSSGQARECPHPLAAPSSRFACLPLEGLSVSLIFSARFGFASANPILRQRKKKMLLFSLAYK